MGAMTMIGVGIVLLAIVLLVGHLTSGGYAITRIRYAAWFLPAWFVIALILTLLGPIASLADAVTTLALAFAVPAAVSGIVMWVTCQQ